MAREKAPGESAESTIRSWLSNSTPLGIPQACSRKVCVPSRSSRYNIAKGISFAFFASVAKADAQAPFTDFSTRDFAVNSDKVRKRRALITLGVTSLDGHNNPRTFPNSSRIGL